MGLRTGCRDVVSEFRRGVACGVPDAVHAACGRVDNADLNAAKVMRQRALRWPALKSTGHSDREASETLWKELRTARKQSKRWGADRAEATTKPACAVEKHQDAQRCRGCDVDSASEVAPTAAPA